MLTTGFLYWVHDYGNSCWKIMHRESLYTGGVARAVYTITDLEITRAVTLTAIVAVAQEILESRGIALSVPDHPHAARSRLTKLDDNWRLYRPKADILAPVNPNLPIYFTEGT